MGGLGGSEIAVDIEKMGSSGIFGVGEWNPWSSYDDDPAAAEVEKEEEEEDDMLSKPIGDEALDISFGYRWKSPPSCSRLTQSSSFSRISGAALSANFTLANTNIAKGVIGVDILPGLDSPNSFRTMTANSPSYSKLQDLMTSSSASTSTSPADDTFLPRGGVKMAGGAAGEDRVQAVCSEENGWLFCGVYDGFNGRDAADFLAARLYEGVTLQLECRLQSVRPEGVMNCLTTALAEAETDFMAMVEEEMVATRPDLVSVGSCVLAMLLHGRDLLYVLNLGDSRAVLAKSSSSSSAPLQAVQLTEVHSVDNDREQERLLADHPDDPSPLVNGRVKGKLKVTRAFGVGYLKKKEMNDALMGRLRVQNLSHPPYIRTDPFTMIHKVSDDDLFLVLGSDGLFDFFDDLEVVTLVHRFIHDDNPSPSGGECDPAKYLIDHLLVRAAKSACFSSKEELMNIPAGDRRKYLDDVTVIVIMLGNSQWTSTASTTNF